METITNHNMLYHYTSLNALRGILENKELWLGNVLSMNDASECSNFIDRLSNNIKKDLGIEYEKDIKTFIQKIRTGVKEDAPFVACFSKLDDNAAQWERYADGAKGVCIGFDRALFERMIKKCGGLSLQDIEYRYNIKHHDHFTNAKNWLLHKKLPLGCKDEKALVSNIIVCSYLHKHKSFFTEEEVRLARLCDTSFIRHEFKWNNDIVKDIRVIDLNEMCEIANIDFESLVCSITVGPKSKQAVSNLGGYIDSLGFARIASRTYKAKCPLR